MIILNQKKSSICMIYRKRLWVLLRNRYQMFSVKNPTLFQLRFHSNVSQRCAMIHEINLWTVILIFTIKGVSIISFILMLGQGGRKAIWLRCQALGRGRRWWTGDELMADHEFPLPKSTIMAAAVAGNMVDRQSWERPIPPPCPTRLL